MRVFQGTMNGTSIATSKEILEAVKKAKQSIRPGIGHRSKLLFTHPNNKEKLGALVKQATEGPRDIFVPFPWRVIANSILPETSKKKTGNIIWDDTKFVKYSSGPAPGSPLSNEEYLSMCLYFGWAKEEEIEYMVWYEVDTNTFEQFIQSAASISHMKHSKLNEDIARELFSKESPKLSNSRRELWSEFL